MYREYERQQLNYLIYVNNEPFANQNEAVKKDFKKVKAELWKYKHYHKEIEAEVKRFFAK